MSAIYGTIDLLNNTDLVGSARKYKEDYAQYAVERVDDIVSPSGFMGCGHQYFTPEAPNEVMPIEEDTLLFTFGGVLDNRAELLLELNLPSDTTDGKIALEAWKKWHKNVFIRLHGVYSLAIYDKANKEVILSNDRFAQRCLFYTVRDSKVYFSTLLYPLLRCSGESYKKNERWLVDEISQRGPSMISEPRETAIEGIYKVVSGTYIIISLDADKKANEAIINYYDPENTYKVNRKITPKQSEVMVSNTMQKIVSEFLRSEYQIASELSCGLDSSSVACTAAGILAKEGRTLNSYTSVPLKEAGLENKGYLVYDETEGVMKIVAAYPNIKPTFIDTAGRNYLLEANNIIADWEMPCKSQQNAVWSDEIMKRAAADGCKIMLTGATGNCTISAGSIENSLYDHLKHGRFIKAYQSLGVAATAGASKKRYLKNLYKLYKDYKKWQKNKPDFYEENITRKDIGEKNELSKRMNKMSLHSLPFNDLNHMHKTMFFPNAYAQIGEVDTKSCLKYGILQRDPMRTDDMMKLCYSLPIECFSWNDYDRRLVRQGMAGIVPECIRHDVRHRGRQSGDMYYRMSQLWDLEKDKIMASIKAPQVLKYLSSNKMDQWFSNLNKNNLEENSNEVLMMIDAYSFSLYMNQLDSMKVM